MPMKTIHCRVKGCGKAIRGKTFAERMQKLRHHRKQHHPAAHRRSVKKALKTKGILDPEIKKRRRLTNKPHVLGYIDYQCKGLLRTLSRADATIFPEFALYLRKNPEIVYALTHAGFAEESRGKWVLRTNKFNIFVYL